MHRGCEEDVDDVVDVDVVADQVHAQRLGAVRSLVCSLAALASHTDSLAGAHFLSSV